MKQALVLIDIQNDYFTGGAYPLEGMEKAAEKAEMLLGSFRRKGQHVIHIRHISTYEGARFFLPDTKGSETHVSVLPSEGEEVVIKHFPNSFRETSLHELLQDSGIDTLVICGAMSNMCIDASVRAAADLGYACFVAQDACAASAISLNGRTVAPVDVHTAFLGALNGAYAVVKSADEIAGDI